MIKWLRITTRHCCVRVPCKITQTLRNLTEHQKVDDKLNETVNADDEEYLPFNF